MSLTAKVVIVGESAVGKTSMVDRFVGRPAGPCLEATLGAQFTSATVSVVGHPVTLQIWDTAGQERFRVLAPMYFRGAHAVVVVYSVADAATFGETRYWIGAAAAHVPARTPLFLAGNKCDLRERRVAPADGADAADAAGAVFFETSAVSGAGLRELFAAVAAAALAALQGRAPLDSCPLSDARERAGCC